MTTTRVRILKGFVLTNLGCGGGFPSLPVKAASMLDGRTARTCSGNSSHDGRRADRRADANPPASPNRPGREAGAPILAQDRWRGAAATG
jgi:hypothetical protein